MEPENLERIRRGYEAFTRGDIEEALGGVDPDIESCDPPEVPDGKVYRGKQGLLEQLATTAEAFESLRYEPEEFVANKDKVLVHLRMVGTGRASGVEVSQYIAHLWTMRGGRGVRLDLFLDRGKALEAAGLADQASDAISR